MVGGKSFLLLLALSLLAGLVLPGMSSTTLSSTYTLRYMQITAPSVTVQTCKARKRGLR